MYDVAIELAAGLVAGTAVLAGASAWFVANARAGARIAALEARCEAEQRRVEDLRADLSESRALADRLTRELTHAQTLAEERGALAERQADFLDRARALLTAQFSELAHEALDSGSQRFLDLAEQRLAAERERERASRREEEQALVELVEPLRVQLGRLDQRTAELEQARAGAFAALREQIEHLGRATTDLQQHTTRLSTALRGSRVRGRWGEVALRNVVELAGMSEHCDFEEQRQLDGGGRPDLAVRLPGGRWIAVDAKAPLDAYLDATEATDDAARNAALDRHVRALRGHVRDLARREYAADLDGDVDLVVLFLPGEPLLGAAFAHSPELQVEALRSRVLLATPATLVALLRTVAIYWQQESLARDAGHIAEVARELHARGSTFASHLDRVGRGLRTAVDAFNSATGSFERRFLPMSRRLEELRAVELGERKLDAPRMVDTLPADVGIAPRGRTRPPSPTRVAGPSADA